MAYFPTDTLAVDHLICRPTTHDTGKSQHMLANVNPACNLLWQLTPCLVKTDVVDDIVGQSKADIISNIHN